MVSLNVLFYIFVLIFALIGAIRGWAKEVIATFSCVLALFILSVIQTYVPSVQTFFDSSPASYQAFSNMFVVGVLVILGYQTPNFPNMVDNQRFMHDRWQDTVLGFIIGAFNGYLIFGSIWYFIAAANYPFPFILAPVAGTAAGDASLKLLALLPQTWLVVPAIYFVIIVAFIFVLVVFI